MLTTNDLCLMDKPEDVVTTQYLSYCYQLFSFSDTRSISPGSLHVYLHFFHYTQKTKFTDSRFLENHEENLSLK